MHKTLLLSFLTVAIAENIIGITYFQSINCSGDSSFDNHELNWTFADIFFQSLKLPHGFTGRTSTVAKFYVVGYTTFVTKESSILS